VATAAPAAAAEGSAGGEEAPKKRNATAVEALKEQIIAVAKDAPKELNAQATVGAEEAPDQRNGTASEALEEQTTVAAEDAPKERNATGEAPTEQAAAAAERAPENGDARAEEAPTAEEQGGHRAWADPSALGPRPRAGKAEGGPLSKGAKGFARMMDRVRKIAVEHIGTRPPLGVARAPRARAAREPPPGADGGNAPQAQQDVVTRVHEAPEEELRRGCREQPGALGRCARAPHGHPVHRGVAGDQDAVDEHGAQRRRAGGSLGWAVGPGAAGRRRIGEDPDGQKHVPGVPARAAPRGCRRGPPAGTLCAAAWARRGQAPGDGAAGVEPVRGHDLHLQVDTMGGVLVEDIRTQAAPEVRHLVRMRYGRDLAAAEGGAGPKTNVGHERPAESLSVRSHRYQFAAGVEMPGSTTRVQDRVRQQPFSNGAALRSRLTVYVQLRSAISDPKI